MLRLSAVMQYIWYWIKQAQTRHACQANARTISIPVATELSVETIVRDRRLQFKYSIHVKYYSMKLEAASAFYCYVMHMR